MTTEQFEQPDLRTKNVAGRGSSYQHPHTGEQVPSVTTISGLIDKSAYLTPWAAKVTAEWVSENIDQIVGLRDPDVMVAAIKAGSEARRNQGRDLGSLAHNTIEALCKGRPVTEIPDKVVHHVNGWKEWCQRYVKRFIMLEETVWSHAHHFAGTFDVLAEFNDGRNVLVDYKTGSDVHVDAVLQLNAMARADCVVTMDGEIPLPPIHGAGVLHLPAPVITKTGRESVRGKWSFREVELADVHWETFLALRKAYHWEKNHAALGIGGKQTSPVKSR